MKTRVLFFLVIFTLISCYVYEVYGKQRRVTLYGRVNDEITGKPLESVEINIIDTEESVLTDKNGKYTIIFPAGEYDIEYKLVDYGKVTKHIKLKSGRKKLNISLLNPMTYVGEEIVVTAKQPVHKKLTVSREMFSKEEIESISGPKEDIFEVVKTLPGVAITSNFSSEFAIRGGDPDETGIFLDNTRVATPFHMEMTDAGTSGGFFSIFNNDMIESITLYSGGFPAEFGDAMSGVIEVEGKKAGQDKRKGNFNISLIDTKFFIDYPVSDNLGVMVAGRRNYIDLLLGLLLNNSEDGNEFVFPSFWDLHLRVDYKPAASDSISMYFLPTGNYMWINFTAEDVKLPQDEGGGTTDIDLKFKWDTSGTMGYVLWEHIFNSKLSSILTLSYNSKTWDYLARFASTNPEFNIDTYQKVGQDNTSVKGELLYSPSETHNMKFGVEKKPTKMNLDIRVPIDMVLTDTGYLVPTKESNLTLNSYFLAGYLQDRWKLAERLYTDIGIRYDRFDWNDDSVTSPRLGVSYGITEKLIARAAYGHFYQFPNIGEFLSEFGGSSNIQALKAEHKIISVEKELREDTTLKIEGFRKDYTNLVSADLGQVIDLDNEIYVNVNEGSGYTQGVEVFIKSRPLGKMSGWMSYTLSEAKKHEYIDKEMVYFDYDRTHMFTVVLNYKIKRRLRGGLTWKLFSGKPYTPFYKGEAISSNRWNYIEGDKNSERLPPFNRLDVRLSKDYIYKSWEMTLYLEVMNLLNNKNVMSKHWNEYKGEMETAFTLPMIPFIGMEARF